MAERQSDQEAYEAYHAQHAEVSGGHDRTRSAPEYEQLRQQGVEDRERHRGQDISGPTEALSRASDTPEVGPSGRPTSAPTESKGNRRKGTTTKRRKSKS